MSTTVAESLELRVIQVREYIHSIGVPADDIPDDRMAGVVGDFDARYGEGWETEPPPLPPVEGLNLEALAGLGRRYSCRSQLPEVWALIHAGWTYEPEDTPWMVRDPYQFRWRRPPRRAGRPGRKFANTGQAYNAMVREREGTVR